MKCTQRTSWRGAMRRAALAAALVVLTTVTSHSNDLSELATLELHGMNGLNYASKRCSAVSLVMIGVIFNNNDVELNKNLNDKYEFFSLRAVTTQSSILNGGEVKNIDKYTDSVMNEILQIVRDYKLIIDNTKAITGKSIPDLVIRDTEFCRLIYDKFKKN